MVKKILIMGLPGSGKTTLTANLKKTLKADWINADKVRKRFNDWDFSKAGVLRQAKRMKLIAEKSKKKYVIADFICPYREGRKIFRPNYLIWMDTIKKGRYPTFDQTFQKPNKYNFRFLEKNLDLNLMQIKDDILGYKWNNKINTIQMMGRYQPWLTGHRKLFEKCIIKTGQVYIMVKDVHGVGDNPFSFKKVKKNIEKDLKNFKKRVRIKLVPNISEICYGRTVGYKIKKIKLNKNIENISATKIRKKLYSKNLLRK